MLKKLFFMAYAQKPPVNPHAHVNSVDRGVTFYPSLYLHPYFVYMNCEGSDVSGHLCQLT